MVLDHSYKVSAFGDFSDIVPDSDTMMFFLKTFKDNTLVPSIFQEVQVGNPQSPISVQRVALISKDGCEQVPISSNRIDYEVKIQEENNSLTPERLMSVNQKIEKFFDVVFEQFHKKANRLALNTANFVVSLNDEEAAQFISKYSNPISIYNNQPLGEWQTRLMVRKESMLNGNNEFFNIITVLNKAAFQKQFNDGKKEEKLGFTVNIDINTVAENTKSRFAGQDIIEFIKIADEWRNSILTEMG